MSILSPAEKLLKSLGITDPVEIDLPAIAWTVNARLRFRHMDGCEARIVGNQSEAIISVNSSSSPRRQRFSIAHELGHWHHHRGRLLICQNQDIGSALPHNLQPERIADSYAADLLMPGYLFDPIIRSLKKVSFQTVDTLRNTFNVSWTAAAIRLIERHGSASLLVCHSRSGRKWFVRSKNVPHIWFPKDILDAESFAFDIMFGSAPNDRIPRKIGADAWFDRRDADRFEVHEQSFKSSENEVLTLLSLSQEMIFD